METIFDAWNNGKCIAGVFCSLTKALDCVNHELLVKKLEFCGVRGVLLNWFRSYLDDRKQRVHPNLLPSSKILNWCNIEHGVPKGSFLCALFFSLFSNDFPVLINTVSDVMIVTFH